jgi:hypothetical protein
MCYRAVLLSQRNMELHYIGYCLSYLILNRQLDAPVGFIVLSKGSYHCDRLSSSHNRMLNLTDMRLMTQSWESYGRSVGPALIG